VAVWDEGIDIALDGIYPWLKAFICVPPLLIADYQQESIRMEQDASGVDAELQSTTTPIPE